MGEVYVVDYRVTTDKYSTPTTLTRYHKEIFNQSPIDRPSSVTAPRTHRNLQKILIHSPNTRNFPFACGRLDSSLKIQSFGR